jgi:glycosyltransferase A (GT-A) superfamily protein (DUF2064 family)
MQIWLQHNGTPMLVRSQQQTPDLGRRMLAALTEAAAAMPDDSATQHQQACEGLLQQQQQEEEHGLQQQLQQCKGYSAVMVIGTDIPDLSTTVLEAAAAALATHDVVLGPARDGGFYLLGFKTEALLKPEVQSGQVFESVQWSTDSVLQCTVAGVQRLGLKSAPLDTLPVLQDVDTLKDLQAWYSQAAAQQRQQQQQQIVLIFESSSEDKQQGGHNSLQQQRQLLLEHTRKLLGAQ